MDIFRELYHIFKKKKIEGLILKDEPFYVKTFESNFMILSLEIDQFHMFAIDKSGTSDF